jgi:hypothetical protein
MRLELRHILNNAPAGPTSRCSSSAKRNSTRATGDCSWVSKWQRLQAGCTLTSFPPIWTGRARNRRTTCRRDISGHPQKSRRNANCRGWRRSSASPKRRNSSPSSIGISSSSRRRRITNSTTWWISGPPFRIVPALLREVRLPRFTCPLAVLRASVRATRLFRQGPLEPLGAPAQRPVDLYRAPFSDTPGVLSIHARELMVSFLNVMRPTAPLRSDDSRSTTLASAGHPTEGLFRVRTSGRAIRRARVRKVSTSFCYGYNMVSICSHNIVQQL